MKKLTFLAFFIIFSFILFSQTKALTYIDSCQELNQEGETYVLTQDIIDSSNEICINISVNNVVLDCKGYTIDGLDSGLTYGIYINERTNITIKNCALTDWVYGIYVLNALNIKAENSNFISNGQGICLINSYNNTFSNFITNENSYGIWLENSENNVFYNFTSNNNEDYGIYLDNSVGNKFLNFTVLNNPGGLFLRTSDYNLFSNFIVDSESTSIKLVYFSNYNEFYNFSIKSNNYGVYLYGSENMFANGKILNSEIGIYVRWGENNLIYNNFFNNTINVDFFVSNFNFWNTTKQLGTRIYSNGLYIGGNYWTNLTGNGYSDTCADEDRDGFCDEPYVLLVDNIDYLPYSNKYSPPAYCGNGICEEGENYTNCCLDCGCPEGYECINNTCVLPPPPPAYCGNGICEEGEDMASCFKDCGGTARTFLLSTTIPILAVIALFSLISILYISPQSKPVDEVIKIAIVILIIVIAISFILNL